MKQTPIQKAHELLSNKESSFIGNRKDATTSSNAEGFKEGLKWALSTLESLLPYEREVIEEVYADGWWEGGNDKSFDKPYYERTFNTDESKSETN